MTEYDTTDAGTVGPAVDPMDAEIRAFGADVLSRLDRIAVALEALADVPGPEHAPVEPDPTPAPVTDPTPEPDPAALPSPSGSATGGDGEIVVTFGTADNAALGTDERINVRVQGLAGKANVSFNEPGTHIFTDITAGTHVVEMKVVNRSSGEESDILEHQVEVR